jgi:hypothetical protein
VEENDEDEDDLRMPERDKQHTNSQETKIKKPRRKLREDQNEKEQKLPTVLNNARGMIAIAFKNHLWEKLYKTQNILTSPSGTLIETNIFEKFVRELEVACVEAKAEVIK